MKLRIAICFLSVLKMVSFNAQEPVFEWGHSFGGTDFDSAQKVVVDNASNVIVTGYFHDTVDFDPSATIVNSTSGGGDDIFIQKLNSDGELMWVKGIGGVRHDIGRSIATDSEDNVFLTGYFNGTVDFDPNAGVTNLTANGTYDDIFVLKLNPAGDFLWVKQVGGASFEEGMAIVVGSDDNVYTTGHFSGTMDFDPGPGTHILTSGGIFVQKLDNDGNFIWANNMTGGTGFTRGKTISTDRNNNVYVGGDFQSTVDFDPGPATASLTADGVDAFLMKLDWNGQFIWAKQMGGNHSDILTDLTIDDNDNLYATGYFYQSADFDPGPGVVTLTNDFSPDIYVLKLNSAGEFQWVRQFGGAGENRGEGIAIDVIGNVFVTGTFANTTDFDPGPDTNNLTAAGFSDSFILKLDPFGNFVWAQQVEGTNSTRGKSIAVDRTIEGNSIVVTGAHRASIDIDPTAGVTNFTSNGLNDFFVLKLFDPLPLCTNLSSPLDDETNVSVATAIDWTAIANAEGYYISIGTTSGGTEIANREDVGNTTNYDPPTDFGENQYIYVTITPYNCVGEAVTCSEERFLTETTTLPSCTNLSLPLDQAPNVPVSTDLSWTAIANATGYYLSIGTTSGGTEIADREDVGNTTTYDPPTDFAVNQDIFVTVVPYNALGAATACLEERFSTEAVILPSCTNLNLPMDQATNVSISTDVSWRAIANATGYYLSIGTTSGGTEIADREDVGNTTTYDPPTDFAADQDIFVTIIPYNAIGAPTPCLEERFSTETATRLLCTNLSFPVDKATNVPVSTDLHWTPIANATGYYLSIGTTSGGTEIADREDVGNTTTYDPPTDFAVNQDIFVTVVPYTEIGAATACSQERFSTEKVRFVIPRFFTPNNDGNNDYWQIEGTSEYSNTAIYIYDRYGKLLRQIEPHSIGWDGTYNNRPMPSDDYWCRIYLENGTVISRHFTLKR